MSVTCFSTPLDSFCRWSPARIVHTSTQQQVPTSGTGSISELLYFARLLVDSRLPGNPVIIGELHYMYMQLLVGCSEASTPPLHTAVGPYQAFEPNNLLFEGCMRCAPVLCPNTLLPNCLQADNDHRLDSMCGIEQIFRHRRSPHTLL